MKKFAAFDIDGTLYRWQLFYSVVYELRRRGLLPEPVARELDETYHLWKGKQISWAEYSVPVINAFFNNLTSFNVEQYKAVCQAVLEQESHKTHAYTRQLLKQLKAEGYTLVAITGSHHDIASLFSKKYEFDYCYGEVYTVKDGYFSGEVETVYNRKDEVVAKFLEEHPDHGLAGSVAVGDSKSDIKMLSLVDTPIAFNPDETLLKVATEKGWLIVVERKNIAYEFQKSGDQIVLVKTNII